MNPTKTTVITNAALCFEILNDPELYSQHCHSLRETLLDHFNHQATLIDTYEHELENPKMPTKRSNKHLVK